MSPSESVPVSTVPVSTVPALARTDVRPAEPPVPESRRRSMGRGIGIGIAVLVAVALLVFGLVFALRHELVDPALLNPGILNAWR
ncbi:hypothetical protein ACFFGH_20775 [Lysobacter korlensis]|uniref:ABC transporter permease n=1 Tax=Lysobacter korlensis TaxID=553636 RepID=A0ABV6RTH1_9GAMM